MIGCNEVIKIQNFIFSKSRKSIKNLRDEKTYGELASFFTPSREEKKPIGRFG
jgi:hypothetical protein